MELNWTWRRASAKFSTAFKGGHLECLMYFKCPNELQKIPQKAFVIKETRIRPKLFEVMLKLETSLLIEINPQVGDIHCIMKAS